MLGASPQTPGIYRFGPSTGSTECVERKQEWLPEGSHSAGWSPAQWGSENLSTASLRRSGCFPAEPCHPERHLGIRQGQEVVARLFEALKIFPAVGGQLVFAVPLPA